MLIAYDKATRRALITDADCDSWKCPECRAKLAQGWTLRAEHGARVLQEAGVTLYFATITSHEKNKTFDACARAFPDAWGKLHKRLNRQADVREYLLVPERHKDGRMHVHAIWTFPVDTRWLKDNGRECGFGYMNQVGGRGHKDQPIDALSRVASYISKYLGKSLGDIVPPRFRRVRTSAGWAKVPAPEGELSGMEWQYIGGNGMLLEHYRRCHEEGYALIDVRTGEFFEDVDLGTIAWSSVS